MCAIILFHFFLLFGAALCRSLSARRFAHSNAYLNFIAIRSEENMNKTIGADSRSAEL